MFKPVADPAAEQRDRLFISDTERVRKEQAIEGEINLQKLDRVGVPLVAPSSHSHKPPKMVVDQPRGNRQQRQVLNVVASTAVGDSSRDDARADSDNTDSEDEVTLHARFRAGDNGGQFRLKQHALAQQREILRLRADLIDARETEASEHQLVKKLRAALQRSLDYCMRAKEWQEQESTAMHSVIGDLKTEVGVLMAYVLNSEHDKQEIEARVQAANEETAQSLQQNHDLVRTVADLRAKLHLAHKDFIGVNQRLEKATQDAANGNELTLKKNETLKATLSRLSKEFAMSNQTRLGLDAKIKDLKFELEHIVYQFNKLGEEKLVADRDNENLRTVLKKWETDFRKLSEEFQRTSEEKFKLSIEHQHLQQTSAATQSELEQRLAKLTGDHEALLSAKTAQDATVAKMSQTLQENATHIKALSEFKATADEKRAKADALFRKEIQARDAVIASTTEELTVERQRSARFLDAKEQLLLEVNDLKNVLDREIQSRLLATEMAGVSFYLVHVLAKFYYPV